jgi:hypothetical protein
MEKEPNILSALLEKAVDYVETNIELAKLKAIDKFSEVTSSVIAIFAVIMFCLIVIILLNIGIALWIGDLLGKVYYGFFVVGAFYIIAGFIFYLAKDKILKKPLADLIIKKFLN